MITIILTYRNRKLTILKRCLESLKIQSNDQFSVVLVDYGSEETYTMALSELLEDYPFVSVIKCKLSGQLWNKSRAINIALKQIESPHVFVGDVDMIYHEDFVKKLHELSTKNEVTYFQVGFLDEQESSFDKAFLEYAVNFKSTHEATGMTLFKTEVLKSINGFDEFYHGWGSEDTDVHVRLQHAGFNVNFYDEELLMLHQWHPKTYREVNDVTPFHSGLEAINAKYLQFTNQTKRTIANENFEWGHYDPNSVKELDKPKMSFQLTNEKSEIIGWIANILLHPIDTVVVATINPHESYRSLKEKVKKQIGKKVVQCLDFQQLNDLLLETIITKLRHCYYQYSYNAKKEEISLIIKL